MDVVPQPSAQLSSTGRPAAVPLTTDHPIERMTVDRTGRYGVSAHVILPDVQGWSSAYRIVVAQPVYDDQDRVIGLMEPADVTVDWIRRQGWLPALDTLLNRGLELIGSGEAAREAAQRDQLERVLNEQDAEEEDRRSLATAFEESVGERAQEVYQALLGVQHAVSNVGTQIKDALIKAAWVGLGIGAVGVGVNILVRRALESDRDRRR